MPKRFIFPLFFPKTLNRIFNPIETIPKLYDEKGNFIECCSNPTLHKIKNNRCVWCGKSVSELEKIMDSQVGVLPNEDLDHSSSYSLPQPDFNSPTTFTVNKPKKFEEKQTLTPQSDHIVTDYGKIGQMDLAGANAYCLKCQKKVLVLEPVYTVEDTMRGSRNYMRGTCAVCKGKICAIMKKG